MFTSTAYAGNGLAVVHDADGLGDAAMQAIARETRLSETTFVQSGGDGADYVNRIFTTLREIPFAGHPSLGTAVAVARARGDDAVTYVQRTHAGLQQVEVACRGGDLWRASMLQEPAIFGPRVAAARALAAIGLGAGDAHPELPVQAVSTGVPQVLIPVRDEAALERCRPDAAAVQALVAEHDAVVLYAFVPAQAGMARARSFLPEPQGVVEDPATGAAAGPLCAYLREYAGTDAVRITQGVEMGRPSTLDAELDGDRPRVSGDVVAVLDGTLRPA